MSCLCSFGVAYSDWLPPVKVSQPTGQSMSGGSIHVIPKRIRARVSPRQAKQRPLQHIPRLGGRVFPHHRKMTAQAPLKVHGVAPDSGEPMGANQALAAQLPWSDCGRSNSHPQQIAAPCGSARESLPSTQLLLIWNCRRRSTFLAFGKIMKLSAGHQFENNHT